MYPTEFPAPPPPVLDEKQYMLYRIPDTLLESIPVDYNQDVVKKFDERYKTYSQAVLSSAQMLRFNELEKVVKDFWASCSLEDISLLKTPFMIELVLKYDTVTYDVPFQL
jgi:hypothetical protein